MVWPSEPQQNLAKGQILIYTADKTTAKKPAELRFHHEQDQLQLSAALHLQSVFSPAFLWLPAISFVLALVVIEAFSDPTQC